MKKLSVDKTTAIKLVQKDAYALEELPDELKNDYEIVSIAVSKKPYAFGSASEKLRNNAEIAMMAIKGNHHTMRYAGEQLMKDLPFLRSAYIVNKGIAEFVTDENVRRELLAS